MLSRLKKLLIASSLPDGVLDDIVVFHDALERGDIKLAEGKANDLIEAAPAKGEFLSDMTEEEILAYERNERLGWKNFKLPWRHDS